MRNNKVENICSLPSKLYHKSISQLLLRVVFWIIWKVSAWLTSFTEYEYILSVYRSSFMFIHSLAFSLLLIVIIIWSGPVYWRDIVATPCWKFYKGCFSSALKKLCYRIKKKLPKSQEEKWGDFLKQGFREVFLPVGGIWRMVESIGFRWKMQDWKSVLSFTVYVTWSIIVG